MKTLKRVFKEAIGFFIYVILAIIALYIFISLKKVC